ncbi:MAG: RNA-directed DNA polymerase [Alphaproteobacteria bacterium]|nr:RNA-directed DNA polymerase [Alphaproteobacteria bacterium]
MKKEEKKRGNYALNQSPLFKLRSQRRLAQLLRTPLNDIYGLLNTGNNYRVFPQGNRTCHDPKPKMKGIHKRLQILLNRIAPPEYLHSATKGRSYVTNAAAHLGNDVLHKLDIRKFFDSTTYKHVHDFFKNTMQCSADVAALLSRITTYDDRLPTGSPISPILAYFAHKSLFDQINQEATATNVMMTCYVDDLSFSGSTVPKAVLRKAKKGIIQRGLEYHKEKRFQKGDTKIVTGVALRDEQMLLPNKRHKKIHEEKQRSLEIDDAKKKREIIHKLISQTGEAARIEPSQFEPLKQALMQVRRNLPKP